MPYVNGQLTPEEVEKLRKWLDDKWKNRPCALCDANKWEASTIVTQSPPFAYSESFATAETLPLIPVVCMNCGHTIWFSAILMGLVTKVQVEKKADRQGGAKDVK